MRFCNGILLSFLLVSGVLSNKPAFAQSFLAAASTSKLFNNLARQPQHGAAQKPRLHLAKAASYDSGGPYAVSVAAADLDRDGKTDLVVADECQSIECASGYGEIAVLLGNGDGTFQSAVTYSAGAYGAFSLAIGDVNGDGIPDIIVADLCQTTQSGSCENQPGSVSVLLGNGDGTFQSATTYNSGGEVADAVAIGSLRGNGQMDLVVANSGQIGSEGSVAVLLNRGNGTFQPAVPYPSGGYSADSVEIGDVNGDGYPDLIALNWCGSYNCDPDATGEAAILLGNGDGSFQNTATYSSGGSYGYSLGVADLTGNGILDLVAAYQCEGNRGGFGCPSSDAAGVLLGDGNGGFQSAVSYAASAWSVDAVAIGDVNGDGIPDLVMVGECQHMGRRGCTGTGTVSVMLGNGDGTFQKPIAYSSGGYEGWAIAIADVNGDGRPDIIVTNASGSEFTDGSVAVLLNETTYRTKTVLTASPNPASVNQSVTLTATVASTPSVPNGETVTFYNGKTVLGSGKTTAGTATVTTSFSKAKTYTIKATYAGDAFRKSSSGSVKLVVNP